jgi:hypothetical protein
MIVKLDTATAGFVVKWKKLISKRVEITPPPTPAILLKVLNTAKTIHPATSTLVGGKTFLCEHTFGVLTPHL